MELKGLVGSVVEAWINGEVGGSPALKSWDATAQGLAAFAGAGNQPDSVA